MISFLNLKNKRNRFIFNRLRNNCKSISTSNIVSQFLEPPAEVSDCMTLSLEVKTIQYRFSFGSSLGLGSIVNFTTVEVIKNEINLGCGFIGSVSSRMFYGLCSKDISDAIRTEVSGTPPLTQKRLSSAPRTKLLTPG